MSNNGQIRDMDTVGQSVGNVDYQEFNNYNEYSLKGIQEASPVSRIFFSKQNVAGLQNTIKYNIYKSRSKRISDQSPNELYTIMRSIYLQNANPRSISENIVPEIHALNKLVSDFAVQNIEIQLDQYFIYKNKIETLPVPMAHPRFEKINYTYDSSNLMQ